MEQGNEHAAIRKESEALYQKMLADLAEIKRDSPHLSAKGRANARIQQISRGNEHYFDSTLKDKTIY